MGMTVWQKCSRCFSASFFALGVFTLPLSAVSAGEMTFRPATNGGTPCCEWIAAEGDIVASTPSAFENFIGSGSYSGQTVYFNSNGGSLLAGIELGRSIRKNNMKTRVGRTVAIPQSWQSETIKGTCLSACSFAFLGGVTRDAKSNEIGVHQFYSKDAINVPNAKQFTASDLSVQQMISGLLIEYATSMGVDAQFVSTAAATPPNEMRFFTKEELTFFKIVVDPDQYKPWTLQPLQDGIVGNSSTNDGKSMATFYCRSDRIPRILFLTIDANPQQSYKALLDNLKYINGINAFNAFYERKNITIKITSKSYGFEIVLDRLNLKQPISNTNSYIIEASGPNLPSSWFLRVLNVEKSQNVFTSVSKNCIK